MARLDALKDPLARAIDRAVHTLEEQLDGQLEDSRRRLREAGEALKSELPAALLADDAVADLAGTSGGAGTAALLEAVARIDAAPSQGGVLQALLDGARVLADRSAFFVARADGLEGWASSGFGSEGDALGGRHVAYSGSWERYACGTGAAVLDADVAASFATDCGVEPATESVLVPLFLRNRLGGFLYADRGNGQAALDTAALRLLTHIAALSLETLPVRAGASATLAVDDGSATSRQPLFLAEAQADAPAIVAEQASAPATTELPAEPAPPVPIEVPEEQAPPPATTDLEAEPADDDAADTQPSPVAEAEAEKAPEPPPELSLDEQAGLEEAAVEAVAAGEDAAPSEPPTTSVKPPQHPAAEELFGEETVTEHMHVDASFPSISADDERAAAEAAASDTDTLELEPIDPSLIEQAATEVAPPESPDFEIDDERYAKASPEQTVRVDVERLEQPADTSLDEAASEDATVMTRRPVEPSPPADPAEADAQRKTTEVQPPSDLSGPGSAFQAGDGAGDEALRDEARRLARLLVSEIKLYNEDPLEEGRREGNIYNRLKEDIDRSRKMYHERIDPRLENADDFFYQELVDRLAGGNADLLGM